MRPECVGIQGKTAALPVMPQSVYLGGPGSVIVENSFALMASADDRIERSGECDPWLAGHGGILPNASSQIHTHA